MSADQRLVYADSSALVKLVIDEPESEALIDYLAATPHVLATSAIAIVEVLRAVGVANADEEARAEAVLLLDSCLLVSVDDRILRNAARLASRAVRTLDAVHLASAQFVAPDLFLVYDGRLADAAKHQQFPVTQPGM